MPRHLLLTAAVLASPSACVVDLALDAGRQIACETAADCPPGFECPAGVCFSSDAINLGGPELQSVVAESATRIVLAFDKPLVPDGVATISNYDLASADDPAPVLTITAAVLEQAQRVVLTVSDQEPGVDYTVVVTGLRGYSGHEVPSAANRKTFRSFGTAPDRRRPDPLLPPRSSVQYIGDVGPVPVAWTARDGAHEYTIEVDDEPSFSPPLVWTTTKNHPTTTAELLGTLEDRTYYWRVRADVTTPGDWGCSSFERLMTTVRVYCDEDTEEPVGTPPVDTPVACPPPEWVPANDCAPLPVETGNRTTPFRSIQRAIEAARQYGLSSVDIAGHGGRGFYAESIELREGVSLYGGWDAAFTARQNGVRSRIVGVGITVLANDIRGNAAFGPTTVLDALSIETRTATQGSLGQLSTGMRTVGCGNALRLHDCAILATNAQDCVGLDARLYGYDQGPEIVDSHVEVQPPEGIGFGNAVQVIGAALTLQGTTAIGPTGVYLRGGRLAALDSTIEADKSDYAVGVEVIDEPLGDDSKLSLIDSRLTCIGGSANVSCIGLSLEDGDGVEILRNRIVVGPSQEGIALRLTRPPGLFGTGDVNHIYDNVIVLAGDSPASPTSVGIWVEDGGASIAHNTVVVGGGATGSAYGLVLAGFANPVVYNNLWYLNWAEGRTVHVFDERAAGADARAIQGNVFAAPEWIDLPDVPPTPLLLYWDDDANALWNDGSTRGNASDNPNGLDGGNTCVAATPALTCADVGQRTLQGSGNARLAIALADLFTDPVDGAGAVSADGDFHLEAAAIAGAGVALHDGAQPVPIPLLTCGAVAENATCPDVPIDADRAARTLPLTPGAYERD